MRRLRAVAFNVLLESAVNTKKHSDGRLLLEAILLIVSFISAFASFYLVATALVSLSHFIALRVLFGFVSSLLLLVGAGVASGDASGLWRLPLRALALAAILAGAVALIGEAFAGDWHRLFGALGLRALICILVGIAVFVLTQRLRSFLLSKQHR
ncbi:hypothetical protein [Rhodanobacter sp. L36]|uniref:hypothetical protein n=1 Tax=Rhodanobacter sp. L36 TaxID=1747221 RepID=UPI00131E36DD|nr:hypothetical protein [Rhodanobacter sp. L36]